MRTRFDVLTLFPGLVREALGYSLLGRAQRGGILQVEVHDLRDWTDDRHRTADDTPYGGGAGMVMKVEPVHRALEALGLAPGSRGEGDRVVLLSPRGRLLDQAVVRRLASYGRIALICGRYEGVDERVALHVADEELSIGDYVLSGGELPALVVVEAVSRMIPGVLGDPESALADSHSEHGLLDHPHYTRPAEYHGWSVPEVLLSGDHGRVGRWRRREALRATLVRRPDLLETADLDQEDLEMLDGLAREEVQASAGGAGAGERVHLERILERIRGTAPSPCGKAGGAR